MNRLLLLVLALALLAGCSKSDEPGATTKDFRSRGLKDHGKDGGAPNAKPAPGQPGGGVPKQ
jgi:uncharacterized lipoprotein